MVNPIFNRKHILEYLFVGAAAAIGYNIPVAIFLENNNYDNLVLLYIGTGAFMAVIFLYSLKLLRRIYLRKRVVSILIACHIATLVGVVLSVLLVWAVAGFVYPHLFAHKATEAVLENAPPAVEAGSSAGLIGKIIMICVITNLPAGSVISVISGYAGKQDQTQDQPAELSREIEETQDV